MQIAWQKLNSKTVYKRHRTSSHETSISQLPYCFYSSPFPRRLFDPLPNNYPVSVWQNKATHTLPGVHAHRLFSWPGASRCQLWLILDKHKQKTQTNPKQIPNELCLPVITCPWAPIPITACWKLGNEILFSTESRMWTVKLQRVLIW